MIHLCLALLFLIPTNVSASSIFAEIFGRPEPPRFRLSYELDQYETKGIKNTGKKLGQRAHGLETSLPLKTDGTDRWKAFGNLKTTEMKTNGRFQNSRPLPNTLWDLNLGVSHIRQMGENTLAASASLGSKSDQPFSKVRDTIFESTLIYKKPVGVDSDWLFFLNFSNGRSFLNYIPLPGFAYFFKATDTLRIGAGLPFFSVFWNPLPKAIFQLNYFPLNNGLLKFSYFLFGPAHAFMELKYQSNNYFLADRTDFKERLFQEEAIATLGFVMPLERYLLLEATGNLSFDRKLFLARKTSDRNNGQLLLVEKAPFASLKLIGMF